MTVRTDSQPTAPGEPNCQRYANPWARFFFATRPQFLAVTAVACLLGLASAYAQLGYVHPARAGLTLLLALMTHAAANVINDLHDAHSGADAHNTGRLFPFTGGSRFIQNGVLTAQQTSVLGHSLLTVAILAGLWLSGRVGSDLLAIGALGIALAWAYSAPPLRLASRGVGELVIAACWLLVVVGTDYVQRGQLAWLPVAIGLPYALLVAALLFINQFPDQESDAATGKRTLVVRLGPPTARWGYLLIVFAAYAWLAVQIGWHKLPPWCATAALSLPLSWIAAVALLRHAQQPQQLRPAIRATIGATLLHGLIAAASLVLAGSSH